VGEPIGRTRAAQRCAEHLGRSVLAAAPVRHDGGLELAPGRGYVALTVDALHVVPAGPLGRPRRGVAAFSVPLTDIVGVSVQELGSEATFEVALRTGHTLTGTTTRTHRHPEVLLLAGEHAATAAARMNAYWPEQPLA